MTLPGQSDTRGWFWPSTARKAHFSADDGRSLCGKWLRINPFTGAACPIIAAADAPTSRDDCVACRRIVDAP